MRRSAAILVVLAAALPAPAVASTGEISTVAGMGAGGSGAEGIAATAAHLAGPADVEPTADGGYLIADGAGNRVRRVSALGTITTVAGTGVAGYNGDGIAATAAQLNSPQGVAALADGGFLIADSANNRLRLVAAGGTITTVAGTGEPGYSGDELFATTVKVDHPVAVSTIPTGGFLIAQDAEGRIRRVYPGGVIETMSEGGFNGPTPFVNPLDVALAADGGFLVAEGSDNRIRRDLFGVISVVAGTGTGGYSGDGAAATAAEINGAAGVTPVPDGGFLIADSGNDRIRRVDPGGAISTVAGSGSPGFGGDGGAATAALLDNPTRVGAAPRGGILIADTGNQRVRFVEGPPRPQLGGAAPSPPANDNTPRIRGLAEAGSTVYLFDEPGCTGVPVAHGTAAFFGGRGLQTTVPDDTVVGFSAVAEKGGIDSGCSEGVATYTEDSTAPNTRIASGPRHPVRLPRKARFGLSASPGTAGARFKCAIDGRALRHCGRTTVIAARPGRHVLRAVAIDVAGNADRSAAKRAFLVVGR